MLGKALLSLLALSAVNAALAPVAEADIEKRDTTLEIKLTGQSSNNIVLASDSEAPVYSEKCTIGRCPGQNPHWHARPQDGWSTKGNNEALDDSNFIESANCVKRGRRTCCNLGKWGWKCYVATETTSNLDVSDLEFTENARPACYKRLDRICCPDSTGKYVCRKFAPGTSIAMTGPCWVWKGEWCCKGFKGRVDCSRHPRLSASEALDAISANTELETDTINECWSSGGQWCCKYTKGRVDCSPPCTWRRCRRVSEVLETITVDIQGEPDEVGH